MNRTHVSIFALLSFLVPIAGAQHTISTVAGGGPNNVAALQAGINAPDAVFMDAAGNLYIAATNANAIYKVDATGTLTTVAGNGFAGFGGDGGPATAAELHGPTGIFVQSGNIFFADSFNNRIREVVAATGVIQTVAGTGTAGYNGDGVSATTAELNQPTGLTLDGSGDMFIADFLNHRIREVVASTGKILTVAGTGTAGYNGNNIQATTAQLNGPSGLDIDGLGDVFIADQGNFCVREVAASGLITDVAGTCTVHGSAGDGGPATSALFQRPVAVSERGGNIFIADIADNRIREVTGATGIIQTVAGNGTAGFTGDGSSAIQAELNQPSGVWVDGSQNIFLTDSLNNRVREVTAGASSIIQTLAGNGTTSFGGDGDLATGAQLFNPGPVFVDSSGNILIADGANNRIRQVVATTGIIQTVAGNGKAGFTGDGGLATQAELNQPSGVWADGSGNIFIADFGNNRIREVVAATGKIQTVAGNGTAGFSGDGGPATSAELNSPTGIFVDGSGNITIADSFNHRIRKVVVTTGNIQTVVGNGTAGFSGDGGPATSAELNEPQGVYIDGFGNIFIADYNNNRIREVVAATGKIQTVAGNGTAGFGGDGGPAIGAELDSPTGVFVDAAENIFIADYFNNRIREVVAATENIQTVVGNGTAGFSGDGGPAASAEITNAFGLFGDHQSNLFITDTGNLRVRKITGLVTIPPTTISASGGTPQSAVINTPFQSPLSATVTDASGNAVGGVTVSFTAPAAGASGSFAGGVSTATTNAAGVATSVAFTANNVAGSYTVTATVSGVAAPATFSLTNNPGPPVSISATGGAPQSAPINSPFASPLAAKVTDAGANPVPGINVTFTAPANGASGSFTGATATATVATNAQGIATSPAFTANSTPGTYNVTAAVAGVQGSANFSLTNLPAPLTITTTSLPSSQLGVAYSQTLAATGGTTPFTWSIVSGTLPAGLTLNASTGVISGTPTTPQTANFTVKVTDSETPAVSQTASLSILVSGNLATLQVLPQPNTVGFGASVQFFAQDASGNAIPVTWSVSPANGGGTISATGLYQASASGSASTTIKVTATAVTDATKSNSVSFMLASNGLSACCTLPQLLTVAVGATSQPTGVQLNGVPSTNTVPFTLSCSGLPVGAACVFTLPHSTATLQSISGNSSKAFCSVITTGPGGTTTGSGAPLPPPTIPMSYAPLFAIITSGAGLLALVLAFWKTPTPMPRRKLAFVTVALVCVSVATLGACSGFSPANVPLPKAQVTPAGTFQIQILATPQPGSGFVQSQLIVPLTVTGN